MAVAFCVSYRLFVLVLPVMTCFCGGEKWTLSKFEREAERTRAALSVMKKRRIQEATAYNNAFLSCKTQAIMCRQKDDTIAAVIHAQEAMLNQHQAQRGMKMVQYITTAQGKIDAAYSAGCVLEDSSKISRMFEGMTGSNAGNVLTEAADIIEESETIKGNFDKIMTDLQSMADDVNKEDSIILSQKEAEGMLDNWIADPQSETRPSRPEEYIMTDEDL